MQSDHTNPRAAFRSTMWQIIGSLFVLALIGLCYGIVLQKKLEESKQALEPPKIEQGADTNNSQKAHQAKQ